MEIMLARVTMATLFRQLNKMKFFAALLLFQFSAARAGDYMPLCPPTIDVEQNLVNTPDGWNIDAGEVGKKNVRRFLDNIEFSDGNPSHLAFLIPTSGKKQRNVDIETWAFTTTNLDGHWISCGYSQTTVAITQKLPDNVKSCSVTFDTSSSNPVAKSVKCK